MPVKNWLILNQLSIQSGTYSMALYYIFIEYFSNEKRVCARADTGRTCRPWAILVQSWLQQRNVSLPGSIQTKLANLSCAEMPQQKEHANELISAFCSKIWIDFFSLRTLSANFWRCWSLFDIIIAVPL